MTGWGHFFRPYRERRGAPPPASLTLRADIDTTAAATASKQLLSRQSPNDHRYANIVDNKHVFVLCLIIIILLHSSTLASKLSEENCTEDKDCPAGQVCNFVVVLSSSNPSHHQDLHHLKKDDHRQLEDYSPASKLSIGICGCPSRHVLWKWRCFPLVPSLNDPCQVSRQCQDPLVNDDRRHCNPITRRCICEVGFLDFNGRCTMMDTLSAPSAMTPTSTRESLGVETSTILAGYIANITMHHVEVVNNHKIGSDVPLDKDQVNTMLYIGLALLCVACLGVLSAIYMKTVKEKRQSQAAIRGLLDLMAENHSLHSVYTTDSVGSPQLAESPSLSYSEYSNSEIATKLTTNGPSKLHLPPLEENKAPKLPSPHLSAPILPPIRNSTQVRKELPASARPRPTVHEIPVPVSIVSSSPHVIFEEQREQKSLPLSAASFPGEITS